MNDNSTLKTGQLQRLMGFLTQDPTNIALLNDALALAIDGRDQTVGQALLTHASTHDIGDARFHAQAAHFLLMTGDPIAAVAHGERALTLGIRHPAVIFNTALAHFHCGHHEQTAELLDPLVEAPDTPAATLLLLARALHHLEVDTSLQAQAVVERILAREQGHLDARGLLALVQYENDHSEEALRNAHIVLSENPDQLDALLACGAVHLEQGNNEAARRVFSHMVQAHPTCGEAWAGLAEAAFNDLDFGTAEQLLQTAVQHMPSHIGTWHMLAWACILSGDSAKARVALERSYEIDRNFGDTHGGLAVVDAMDGYEDKARAGIKRALKLDPQSLAARYAQSLLIERTGDKAAAVHYFGQVLDSTARDDTSTWRQLAQKRLSFLRKRSR